MADAYQEELIGISEKLGKYNKAQQDSLNILSDEFLLLRDELSTLNQNLEKTKGLDEKIEEFNKTAAIFASLKDRLATLEKISESMSVAEKLAERLDAIKGSVDSNKEQMGEVITPLNKKMDLLFSKFDESLSPLAGKMDMSVAALKEEIKETTQSLKEEESIKNLAVAIGEEISKLEKTTQDQNNSIRSVSTSVAYLSQSEGDLKKSLDYLIKTYEQDRELAAKERAQKEQETKKGTTDSRSGKLEEIAALLKVQMEQIQKQDVALEGIKNSKGSQGQIESLAAELKKLSQELAKNSENQNGQLFLEIKKNNQELAKSLTQVNPGLSDEIKKQNEEIAKLQSSLIAQNKLLAELKSSLPTGNFAEVIAHADLVNQSTNAKLDAIIESAGKNSKNADVTNGISQLPSLMQNISSALDALVDEMKKSQHAYKNLESRVEKVGNFAENSNPEHMEKLEAITENIKGLHSKIEMPKDYEPQLRMVIDELKKFEQLENERLKAPQITPQVSQIDDKTGLQLTLIKKELSGVNANVEEMRKVLLQGADISAEVDFAPLLRKMEEMEFTIQSSIKNNYGAIAASTSPKMQSQPLPPEKLFDQREILEEIQNNIKIFQQFELSERAKIVVERIATLSSRALSLYSN